jgi:hypothetical protein
VINIIQSNIHQKKKKKVLKNKKEFFVWKHSFKFHNFQQEVHLSLHVCFFVFVIIWIILFFVGEIVGEGLWC